METFIYTGNGETPHVRTFSGCPEVFILAGLDAIVIGGGPDTIAAAVFNTEGRARNGALIVLWDGSTVTLTGDKRALANQSGNKYLAVAFYKA